MILASKLTDITIIEKIDNINWILRYEMVSKLPILDFKS